MCFATFFPLNIIIVRLIHVAAVALFNLGETFFLQLAFKKILLIDVL